MVVGVSLVILVAVFLQRKDTSALDPAAATIVKPAADFTPRSMPVSNSRPVQAKAIAHTPVDEAREYSSGR
jgi:hypothetical protein